MKNSIYNNYEPPTSNVAISMLAKFSDKKEAQSMWQSYCEVCDVAEDTANLNELEAVFNYMVSQPGNQRLVGRSLIIRSSTFKILKNKK